MLKKNKQVSSNFKEFVDERRTVSCLYKNHACEYYSFAEAFLALLLSNYPHNKLLDFLCLILCPIIHPLTNISYSTKTFVGEKSGKQRTVPPPISMASCKTFSSRHSTWCRPFSCARLIRRSISPRLMLAMVQRPVTVSPYQRDRHPRQSVARSQSLRLKDDRHRS